MTALGRCSRVVEQAAEHRVVIVAMVPLPDPLVQVTAKPVRRDRVVHTAHVGLEVAEEALDGIRVRLALDLDALRVADAPNV